MRREDLHVYNESVRIEQTEWTDYTPQVTGVIASDPTVPSAPTLAATAADQAIDLTITPPTTNTNGTAITDLRGGEYVVYYSTSSGIDTSNPTTYSGTFSLVIANTAIPTRKTFPTSAQHYFVATAADRWSNTSTASSEVNATPTVASGVPVSVDDYTDNIANVYVGKGMIGIEFQPPKSSWERWAGWRLYTANDGGLGAGSLPADPTTLIYTGSGGCFLHKGLNESYLYEYKLVVLGEDGTVTSGTISDNTGAGYQPNAADNSALLAETIMAERIFATTELYAQDAVIGASGSLRSGQTAYNTGIGWWIGDAAGTPKFSVGNPAGKWLTMDGTNFAWNFGNCSMDASGNLTASSATLSGAITATSGTIGGFTCDSTEGLYTGTGATRIQMKAGVGLWLGATAFADAPFKVSPAGAVTASNINCTNLTVGAGSSWGGNAIGTAYIPNLNCDKITSGTFSTVRIPNLSCSKITSGTFDAVRIPNLSATKITSDTMSAARISGGTIGACTISASYLTAGTLNFGAISRSALSVLNSELAGGITYGKISSVDAATITTGILTGRTIRTSSSNPKAVLTPSDGGVTHCLAIYDSSARLRTWIYQATVTVKNASNNYAATLSHDGSGNGGLYLYNSSGNSRIQLLADDTPQILGNSSYPITLSNVIGRFSYSGSTVYNSTAPTSWTDLNLSSYVGSRYALVLLQIENNGGSDTNYRFRMNGQSGEQFPTANDVGGVFGCKCDTASELNYVWCMTDSSGKIEWDADVASSTVVTLLAYIS